jgi:hypothetical protein
MKRLLQAHPLRSLSFSFSQPEASGRRHPNRYLKPCECFLLPLLSIVCSVDPLASVLPIGWHAYRKEAGEAYEIHLEHLSDRKAKILRTSSLDARGITVGEAAEKITEKRITGVFDARLLLIPPLIPKALWLKCKGRGPDRVVIMSTTLSGIKAGDVFTPKTLIARLVKPARELLEYTPQPLEATLKGSEKARSL